MSDFDSPWKEALDQLAAFLEFFFPLVYAGIDWNRSYEILDKELETIVREGELGKRLADKLFKVWRKDGEAVWILIHIEIQSQRDTDFAERMYIYNYRIYDTFRRHVVSLAVLGDEYPNWRPFEFGYNEMGCEVLLRFPIIKLLDYGQLLSWLETHDNPFGLIVLTHLQAQATRDNPEERCTWKIRLAKGLLERGWDAQRIRLFFKFIDWMMNLPDDLAKQFEENLEAYEQEKNMPYITTIERRGMEIGRKEGREEGREEGSRLLAQKILEKRFGSLSDTAKEKLEQWPTDRLVELVDASYQAKSLQEIGLE